MIAAVVSAKNEAFKISRVLKTLDTLPLSLIVPVINGSSDSTLDAVINTSYDLQKPVQIIASERTLGPDVPRAIGARIAWEKGMSYVLFIDGDMDGNLGSELKLLINNTLYRQLDMSLTDCYLNSSPDNTLAELVLYFRRKLNKKIGHSRILGDASPSHGPLVISRKLMNCIPLRELAIPPVSLSLAVKQGLNIDIGVRLAPECLGNQYRNENHSLKMSKMIIGDCIEAINSFDEKPRSRFLCNREYTGLHLERNWNLLDSFLKYRDKLKRIPAS